MCAVSTHEALLHSSASIVTVVTEGPHALTGRAPPLPAATATAAGLLTKVGSDLDAACGAVGAAVASDLSLYLNRSFHCVATKRQQAEFSLPLLLFGRGSAAGATPESGVRRHWRPGFHAKLSAPDQIP